MATTTPDRSGTEQTQGSGGKRFAQAIIGLALLLSLGGIVLYVLETDSLGDAIPGFALFVAVLGMLIGGRLWRRLEGKISERTAKVLADAGTTLAEASWLLPVIGFAAVITILGERPDEGQNDFFSAAAQVIPVLALALAIEATGFRERFQSDSVGRATALVTLLLLAYGEFEALEGLADTEHDGNDAEIVWAALASGGLGIVLVALRAGPTRRRREGLGGRADG